MKPWLSEGQLKVLEVLWERGDATVWEVKDVLDSDRPYPTHLSRLQALEEKGYVTPEKEGKAYRYHPAISREDAQREALRRVIRQMFDSRPEDLVSRLIKTWEPTEEERQQLLRELKAV